MVNLRHFQRIIAPLPADCVPAYQSHEEEEGKSRAPVYQRVTEKEVFDDVVVPAAHAEADVEDGPLPELGGEVVLFVWVRDKGVVGGHHSDVEVHEVAEEGGAVGVGVCSGH